MALAIIFIAELLHVLWNYILKSFDNRIFMLCLGQTIVGIPGLIFCLCHYSAYDTTTFSYSYKIAISAFLHASALYSLSVSYKKLDMSITYPILKSSSILFSLFLGISFFKESLTNYELIGILLIIIGIMSCGNFNLFKIKNIIYAFLSGCFVSLYCIIDKNNVSMVGMHPFYYSSILSFITGIILIPISLKKCVFSKLSIKQLILSVLIGIFGMTGFLLIIILLKNSNNTASILSLRQISIIIGFLIGVTVLKEKINLKKILSIIFIIFGVYFISVSLNKDPIQ